MLAGFGEQFFVHDFAAMRHEAAFDDFVVELEHEGFFFLVTEFFDEIHEVRRVNLTGVQRRAAGQIGNADNFDAVAINDFVVSVSYTHLTLPTKRIV